MGDKNPIDSEEMSPTLDELFMADPRELSDQDLDRIIDALRAAYHKWASNRAAAQRQGKRPKYKAAGTAKAADLKSILDSNIDAELAEIEKNL